MPDEVPSANQQDHASKGFEQREGQSGGAAVWQEEGPGGAEEGDEEDEDGVEEGTENKKPRMASTRFWAKVLCSHNSRRLWLLKSHSRRQWQWKWKWQWQWQWQFRV